MTRIDKYAITVRGCDDETVAHVELTLDEAAAVKRVADRINEVRWGGCMPSMNLATGQGMPAETDPEES